MLKKIYFIFMLILSLGLMGCAGTYQVLVNGYVDPKTPAPFAPGAAFFVIGNKDAQNPLLEKEVKEKSARLLEKMGYRLAPFEKAEYYLLFAYGIGAGRPVVTMPDYTFGFGIGAGLGSGYYGRRNYVFGGPFFGGYYPYPAVSTERAYDRWLILSVIDAKHYREKGDFRTLWVGEARSSGTSSDLREMINYLLVAAFEQFGKDTKKAVGVDLERTDPRVKDLEK
ncbi:MAG: DUF4136 domain-containing protein [Deltaproteobacteria bacterium]|nr:DUF4136 domain-containing protein [Deltaproteobacteria bacterium]